MWIGVGLSQSCGNRGVLDVCLCLGCSVVVGEWVGAWTRIWRYDVVVRVSLDYLCRWHVQVYVYCARRIPEHLRCTLSISCFLSCICLWQKIQNCLCVVVGLGFASTSPAFRSSSSHQAYPMAGLPKTVIVTTSRDAKPTQHI